MGENESFQDFKDYCKVAADYKIAVEKVFMPLSTYISIHIELTNMGQLRTIEGGSVPKTNPFTKNGKQTLYALVNHQTSLPIQLHTVKPAEFQLIN